MCANYDWLCVKLEIRAVIIVRATTKVDPLRNNGTLTHNDTVHAVKRGSIANSDMVAQIEVPRCPYPDAWIDMNIFPKLGTKNLQ